MRELIVFHYNTSVCSPLMQKSCIQCYSAHVSIYVQLAKYSSACVLNFLGRELKIELMVRKRG